MESPAAEPVNPRIRVEVETSYIEEQSDPRDKRFVFSCTITIRNEGQVPARLLTRHWIITDANGNVKETRGDGVVGEQPYLKPGQGFRYSTGAVIETPVGTIQGSYQMVADNGVQFAAPDRGALLEWLPERPVMHEDATLNVCMVHAGLAPQWDLN